MKNKKKEYYKYLISPQWKEFRKKALDFHGRKCNRCPSISNLQVHHKHYKNIFNESIEDVEILCKSCHAKQHKRKIRTPKKQINKPKKKKFRHVSNNNLKYRNLSFKKPKKW